MTTKELSLSRDLEGTSLGSKLPCQGVLFFQGLMHNGGH